MTGLGGPSAATWLTEKAKSYSADAGLLDSEDEVGDFTGRQWAIVYRAVAAELSKCAADVPA